MARRRSPEETALLQAQAARLNAETEQGQQELQQKGALSREQMNLEQLMNQGKLNLGYSESGSRERQARLGAAMEALGQEQKGSQFQQTNQTNLLSDILNSHLITDPSMVGDLLKAGGSPLANAFSAKQARDRETAIQAVLPAIKGAKSDQVRETGIKPALAKYPGAYEEALARAFPKPENASLRTPPTTEVPAQTVKESAGATSPLANTLLQLAGVNRGQSGEGASSAPLVDYNVREPNYTGIGHGPLEGSKRTDVGGQSQLNLPSGGFASVNTPTTPENESRLSALIAPRGAASSVVSTTPVEQAPIEPSVAQAPTTGSTWDQLIAQPGAAPTPTPVLNPVVAATLPENPAALLAPTPTATLIELARRQQQQNQAY